MQVHTITWMHPSYFASAVAMNKASGLMHENIGWLNRLYKKDNVFSMGVFNGASELLGWSTYRKTTSGIEILWMIVPDENRGNGIGGMMIDRMKGWMHSVANRRGALTCNVHQYADDLLYFLRGKQFEYLKINPNKETYRMIWIGESKKDSNAA